MTRYFKDKNSNSYFVTNSEVKLSKYLKEITEEQYKEETGQVEETPEE